MCLIAYLVYNLTVSVGMETEGQGSAYRTLHHEVLMALAGYPGNLFMVSKDSGVLEVRDGSIKESIHCNIAPTHTHTHTLLQIVPGLPFIHPSERELLNKICRLGTYYLHLKEFISEQNRTIFRLPIQGNVSKGGKLYLKSLAYGLDRVLNGYRQHLADVEKKVNPIAQLRLMNVIYYIGDT